MTKDEKILEILKAKPSQKIGLDDFYGRQTVLNMLKEAINFIPCCELLPIGKEVTLVDSEEMSYYSGKKTTIKGYTEYLGKLHYKTGLEGIFTIEDFVR